MIINAKPAIAINEKRIEEPIFQKTAKIMNKFFERNSSPQPIMHQVLALSEENKK